MRKGEAMAIEVKTGEKEKIILDFWTSSKGKQREFLTARRFYANREGKWFPDPKNGCYFTIENWNQLIPKLRDLIYYKTAPPGAPPFESDKEGKTFEETDRGESPGDDF